MRCFVFRNVARFIVGVSSAFVLAACGSGPEQDGSPPPEEANTATAEVASSGPDNACVLLTAADVGSVVGEAVRDSLALDIPGGGPATASQCNYAIAENPAAVSVLLRRGLSGETAGAASERVRQTFTESGIEMEDVPDVGEAAFWGSNQLHVFVDENWYLVISPVSSAGLTQARALADLAMAKL